MKTMNNTSDEVMQNLLLNPDQIRAASDQDLAELEKYVINKQWKSLYRHDRPLHKLMRYRAACLQVPLAILLRRLQAVVVKQERTRKGMTRKQLARCSRLTVSVVRNVERRGAAKLTLPQIWRLSSVLDLYREWSDAGKHPAVSVGGTTKSIAG